MIESSSEFLTTTVDLAKEFFNGITDAVAGSLTEQGADAAE